MIAGTDRAGVIGLVVDGDDAAIVVFGARERYSKTDMMSVEVHVIVMS
jgi:hypothetical protein